jgi:hypothetical protein
MDGTAPIHDDRLLGTALIAVYHLAVRPLAREGTLPRGRLTF